MTSLPGRAPPPAWMERAYAAGLSLLVGAQVAVGYLVAPALFAVVPDRTLAGTIAGEIFARLGWISLAVLPLLALLQWRLRQAGERGPAWEPWLLPAMLVLTAVGHLWLRPWIAAVRTDIQAHGGFLLAPAELRARFGMLHGVSSSVFLAVSLLGLLLLLRLGRLRRSA